MEFLNNKKIVRFSDEIVRKVETVKRLNPEYPTFNSIVRAATMKFCNEILGVRK